LVAPKGKVPDTMSGRLSDVRDKHGGADRRRIPTDTGSGLSPDFTLPGSGLTPDAYGTLIYDRE
jgi:hypothetical protein